MILDDLRVPIVLAPLSGGPSTPELAAAVCEAGGLGFLAAGYLSDDEIGQRIASTRALTRRPFGVNVFVPGRPSPPQEYEAYLSVLGEESRRAGVDPGIARFDTDDWEPKIARLTADPVPVVSFTFGCPVHGIVTALQKVGSEVWVTVTTLEEAIEAVSVGADALIVQGAEAGGHRGSFIDDPANDLVDGLSLLALLQLVLDIFDVPCVAAGGLITGRSVAAVLTAGAVAAQLGTAFLRTPEAGTSTVHRAALESQTSTAMTRAFSGRLARGVRNRFIEEYSAEAPAAYPEIHFATLPLRQAGRDSGDGDVVNLWAGQTHVLGRELPAAEIVRELDHAARAAIAGIGRKVKL